MPVAKTKREKGEAPLEKLPANYHEFFEKKTERAKAFMEKHPIPEGFFKKQN